MVKGAEMREGRNMPATGPSLLDLDVLRASLGATALAPYEHAVGPHPWLTAGTLTWAAADAPAVLPAWRGWTAQLPASAVTAARLGEHVVAVDVALSGDPWRAAALLAPLRALGPATDTVGLASPSALLGRRGGAPAAVTAAAAPLVAFPDVRMLLAARIPAGVSLGIRHDRAAGPALIAVGIAADAERLHLAVAALDRTLRVRATID
jgi:hypothetical protein